MTRLLIRLINDNAYKPVFKNKRFKMRGIFLNRRFSFDIIFIRVTRF